MGWWQCGSARGWCLVRALKTKFEFETHREQGGCSYLGINGPNEIFESMYTQNYTQKYITYVYVTCLCVVCVCVCRRSTGISGVQVLY